MELKEQIKEFSSMTDDIEVKYWIEHNLKNFLEKSKTISYELNGEKHSVNVDKTAVEHIIDYFKSGRAPSRLKKMSVEEAYTNAEKWTKALVKRNRGIFEQDGDIEVIHELTDDFALVKLVGENAFKREGTIMGHCVASYYNRTDAGGVYSLRSPNNEPHCTLEIRGERIMQIKGKQNKGVLPRYIKYVFEALEKMDIKVEGSNEQEFKNIDYFYVNAGAKKFLSERLDKLPDWEIVDTKIGSFMHRKPSKEELNKTE
jgi:hypothetical protein